MNTVTAYAKGVMGEIAARHFLEDQGMYFVDSNYRIPGGEIDLIMLDRDTLVFVEVKCREYGTAEEAAFSITHRKMMRIAKAAKCWLSEHSEYSDHMVRFDAVLIAGKEKQHISNAFEVSENE